MNRKIFAGAFAVAALASTSAFSQSYVGIGGGASHLSAGCDTGVSCDNSDTAVKLFGGYEFPNKFAAEVSWMSLGKFKADSDLSSADAKGSYWGIGGAYRPDFGSGFGGVARVGAAYGEGKVDYSLAGIGGSETHHDWHPYYGLGVNYALTNNIKVNADWEGTRLTTESLGNRSTNTVNTYMVGATFGF